MDYGRVFTWIDVEFTTDSYFYFSWVLSLHFPRFVAQLYYEKQAGLEYDEGPVSPDAPAPELVDDVIESEAIRRKGTYGAVLLCLKEK